MALVRGLNVRAVLEMAGVVERARWSVSAKGFVLPSSDLADLAADGDADDLARAEAAEACTFCPARAACGAFADANNELGRDVEAALERLRQAVAESPIVQAQAAYLAAQYVRNWAHVDLMGARGRLGLPTDGARAAGTTDLNLQELIDTTTQREAQRLTDAHRQEQVR